MSATGTNLESGSLAEIQAELAEYADDPLGFVMVAYPWGEGELENESGPRAHQVRFLDELGQHLRNPLTHYKPFRKAVSSGHGIGKSTELSWVAHWGLSTFEDTKVIVMAGTGDQLKTKTQPEVAKWFRIAANAALFEVMVTSIKVREEGHEATWRADFNTWSEENPQASAGAHNKGKRLIIIYDEASGIHDAIWKTQEGALTDEYTEIIWIALSQCTRSEGAFYDAVFGDQKHRWHPEVIDSRDVEGTNVEEINETIQIYGENSDEARVRYYGLFPLAGAGKYIDLELVQQAQHATGVATDVDPIVAGADFAWGGPDNNVIRFRKGLDARSIPPVKVKGHFTKDPAVMIGKIVDVLDKTYDGEKVAMMFFDSAGIASSVYSGVRALGYEDRIMLVNFGADSPRAHCAYWRDFMWDEMKKWMQRGGAIDKDHDLAADLQKPILVTDRLQRVKLESKDDMRKRWKKMGIVSASPDDGDALALTFAAPVTKRKSLRVDTPPVSALDRQGDGGWMA
jgi:hypothetical protein